jgi:uncharacterized phiE125 gp8 family phage protein
MPLQLINPPAEEPVSLAEAKLHLRVDFPEDDALIMSIIAAARQHAEMLMRRQIVTARWKLVLDCFPRHVILLPRSPLQSVLSIEYLDMASTLQTMPSSDYTVDAACEPARITPVFGAVWPSPLPQIAAVSVRFDAGYGTASAVPEGIKAWIKLRVGSLYEHREDFSLVTRGRIEPLPFVDGLLDPYRVISF